MTAFSPPDPEAFIARWRDSSASERANYQMFLSELAVLLGQDPPDPARGTPDLDGYCFDRPVPFRGTGSTGFIDLYKRGCFVLEAKQGSSTAASSHQGQLALLPDAPAATRRGTAVRGTRGWDDAMVRARGQAEQYARALPDEYPPFLVTVDIGHVIELFADFSRTGKNYTHFPDATRFRIRLEDLRDPAVRDRLRLVWSDPDALDPARTAARVTREIATRLAALGLSFEAQGHAPDRVARFLMRCLFSMFAEDVRLIPEHSFRDLLTGLRGTPEHVAPTLTALWASMDQGGFSPVLRRDVLRFNGGLFADTEALPTDNLQLSLLIEAASADWREVEPAIFGTLLERALSPRERHKLGAHYTPRPYVERLVLPTLVEPLRADWENARAAALRLAADGKEPEARATLHAFHRQLCETRVLDPACGSGNFLYVALEAMKRLEGEVTDLLKEMGETQGALHLEGLTVDPHQFLGLELNPWAAAVAELVLWIGYLQWHYRTHGRAAPSEPVLKNFHNIENRDAVLTWDATTPRLDPQGRPVTRWDGLTTVRHPVTGDPVPDPEARTQVLDYTNPRPAPWPEATFIVGNPPFIGKLKLREVLGDGYVEALRRSYPKVPRSADFVMYWWEKAALRARAWDPEKVTGTRRFGLITTNSLRQTFGRRVVAAHLSDRKHPLSLLFAIPDHPWVEASDGAAVRIAMTVGGAGLRDGRLLTVSEERASQLEAEGRTVSFSECEGKISAALTVSANVATATPLKANERLATMGFATGSRGFLISAARAKSLGEASVLVRPMLSPREIVATRKHAHVIDASEINSEDELSDRFPKIYQYLRDNVYPQREHNRDEKLRREWWKFRRSNEDYRKAVAGMDRHIVTLETAKHRPFIFIESPLTVEHGIIAICLRDAAHLAILSSDVHITWALAAGGTLEDRPRYNKTRCFDPFPFPDPDEPTRTRLRDLGERLDAHRKRQQAAHPGLTLTQMYNVLEKLRSGLPIEGRDREVYDQGLVGILRQLHDAIDAETTRAYGWPAGLADDAILHRLVALNRERAAEEARGHVRWLRPAFQNPAGQAAALAVAELDLGQTTAAAVATKPHWPTALPEQMAAVREALAAAGEAAPADIARRFRRARADKVAPLLATLAALGHAHATEDGRFAA
jgi:hypothetical protein